MKLKMVLEIEIEGELDPKRVRNILSEHLKFVNQGITSEEVDGTDDWLIYIRSWGLL